MFLRSLLLSAALVSSPAILCAQGASIGFGDAGYDRSAPVEITADQLGVSQTDGRATFTGNVVVGQGDMRLTGAVVEVEYEETAGQQTEVKRLHASGGVTLFNGTEAAEGAEAVYEIASGEVVMTGDVVLTQGENAMSGDKLTVNLETGTGLLEGRVRVVFKAQESSETSQ